jgi:hypothetical protein
VPNQNQAVPLSVSVSQGRPLSFSSTTNNLTTTNLPTLQVSIGLRIEEIEKATGNRVSTVLVPIVSGSVSTQRLSSHERTDIVGQTLSNGAQLDLTIWSYTQDDVMLVGGQQINISANTIKQASTLRGWPFLNSINELSIEADTLIGDTVVGFDVAQTSVQNGDPVVTYTLASGLRLQVLTRLGGMVDGNAVRYDYRIGTNGTISLRVPSFRISAMVDPSFQIFMQDAAGRSNSTGPSSMTVILASSLATAFIVLLVAVAVATLLVRYRCPEIVPRWLTIANLRESEIDSIQRGRPVSSEERYRLMQD